MIEIVKEDLDRVFTEFDRRVAFRKEIGHKEVNKQEILQGVFGTLRALSSDDNWVKIQAWLPEFVGPRL